MKKLNSKGFTLIELLAVITIMGILMMVAIPSVSRTIENSRRDTFANIAHEYINAVRNNVMADNIECDTPNGMVVASATADGWYYFVVDTTEQGTKDLMESGGKSPFGNAEMRGYILWKKASTTNTRGDLKTKTTYYSLLVDTGKHGYDVWLREESVKRAKISTATTRAVNDLATLEAAVSPPELTHTAINTLNTATIPSGGTTTGELGETLPATAWIGKCQLS